MIDLIFMAVAIGIPICQEPPRAQVERAEVTR